MTKIMLKISNIRYYGTNKQDLNLLTMLSCIYIGVAKGVLRVSPKFLNFV